MAAQVVQACHAAHEAGAKLGAPSDCFLILTIVPDLLQLQALGNKLSEAAAGFVLFTEPDLGNQPTALATLLPHNRRHLCAKLPLWRLP